MSNRKRHGMTGTRIYRCWYHMIQRCAYRKRYIQRGISVCEEWLDFSTFYAWAMKNGYNDNLTLDRIDNNGNYEPSNCRWATAKMQANNRENTILLEHDGQILTISEWAEKLNIKRATLANRYFSGVRGDELFFKGRLGVSK